MMTESADREVSIFGEALASPPSGRSAYLDGACAEDSALRQRVEALLAAHEKADTLYEDLEREAQPSQARGIEKPGSWIGPYRLLEQIGEGGCGEVYRAEQLKPIHREVALKIIKLGMDTKAVVARFEA